MAGSDETGGEIASFYNQLVLEMFSLGKVLVDVKWRMKEPNFSEKEYNFHILYIPFKVLTKDRKNLPIYYTIEQMDDQTVQPSQAINASRGKEPTNSCLK